MLGNERAFRTTRIDGQPIPPLPEIIVSRRTTGNFKPDPVPDDVLEELLHLALLAPSGFNLQPWRFVVVRDLEARKRLRAAAMNQKQVEQAPVVVVACGHTTGFETGDLDAMIALGEKLGTIREPRMSEAIRRNVTGFLGAYTHSQRLVWVTRQVMIALTQLMLAAEAYGLDTAPLEGFLEDKVKETLGIPADVAVVALLAIGFSAGPERAYGGRFPMNRLVSWDRWAGPQPG